MVIGIGGVSRSGKSTLAALILRLYTEGGKTAVVLAQDDCVFPPEQIPTISHGKETEIDWETPESIDFQRYKNAILEAKMQFDHVITEGLLNFYDADLNALYDKFLFVDIPKTTFLQRKADDKRWGEVPSWFVEHIWASYEKFGKTVFEDKKRTVFVLSGEADFDVKEVINFLKK